MNLLALLTPKAAGRPHMNLEGRPHMGDGLRPWEAGG